MSAYNNNFTYNGINSKDKNLIVVSFDPDDGFMDSFLSMDNIYTESYDGSIRYSYGSKYNSVAEINITLIKKDNSDFSISELRNCFLWLTGSFDDSWLDLYNENNELQYSFLGKITNVQERKMDSRCIGLMLTFTSVSPWAFSPINNTNIEFKDKLINKKFFIENNTDENNKYIYLNLILQNKNSTFINIKNESTNEITKITNIKNNEKITISSGQFILSDDNNRIFGNDFNFIWPRLIPGKNNFNIQVDGDCVVKFSYRHPIKIGNLAI